MEKRNGAAAERIWQTGARVEVTRPDGRLSFALCEFAIKTERGEERLPVRAVADPFPAEKMQIYRLHDLPQEEKGDAFGVDSILLCGAGEHCRAQARLFFCGDLTAVELSGEVAEEAPSFGCQDALLGQGGVGFSLSLPGQYPFVSIYQHKEWWLRPAFGADPAEIPQKSQLLIRREEAGYQVFLAVSGKQCRADLSGSRDGLKLELSSNETGRRRMEDLALVCGYGADPYALTERMVRLARELTGKELALRGEKAFPQILEKWGWCTWDSLGRKVSEAALFEKMEDFKACGIRVPWVLIDDGWMDADRESLKLKGLGGDPARFPEGLSATVRTLKERYGVEQVGVWQAVKGYWNGVEPHSEAGRELAPFLASYPNGECAVKPEPWAAFGFWDAWHSRLKEMGVSFVKIDSQSSFSLMSRGAYPYGAEAAVHKGMEASAELHFGGNLINCMGMAPEDVWNRPGASLSRSSDDFQPTVPGSFAEHALQNSYNSVLQGCFCWGDWDMAWSVHEDAAQNLLLRAVSGGPFYLSDGVGATDPKALLPMVTEDGTVLRCQDVGRPTLDCLTEPGVLREKPLKVYNRCGSVIYIAAFLDRKGAACRDALRLLDIPGAEPGDYWVYDFARKRALPFDGSFGFVIQPGEALLYQLIPAKGGVTVIGMTDKYISAAGIGRVEDLGKRCLIWPCCSGELSFLTEGQPVQITCYGGRAGAGGRFVPRSRQDGRLVTVAWAEKGMVVEICTA